MFYNCKTISNIPINFKLHKNLIDMSYMFYNCFDICITNAGFKPGMMPDNGFYNSTTNINVTSMFENCTKMTGQPRSRLLWFSPYNIWYSNNCYAGCKELDNWEYIPSDWGGGGKEDPFIFEIKLPKRSDNKYQVTLPIASQLEDFYQKGLYYTPLYIYNFRIDWGDDTNESYIKNWQSSDKTHVYNTYGKNGQDGIFTIKIYGLFEGWDIYNTKASPGDCNVFSTLLYKIISWGNVDILYTKQFCCGCINLISIPDTLLPIPLVAHNQTGIGKINAYDYGEMFLNCRNLNITDNVNLPIDEKLLNFNSIKSIETTQMFLNVDMTTVPKMFDGKNNILKKLKKLSYQYSFGLAYTNTFCSSNPDFPVDLSIKYCNSIDDFSRMITITNRAKKIRYKFDETDENEIAHENQISALVQETTPNSPSAYFIYPRYAGDDLIYNRIFLKHPLAYNGTSVIWLMFSGSQYITRYADYEFKIIFEDLSKSTLEEYNYKNYITTFNDEYSGMSYVEDSYNEIARTFRLKYTHSDGKTYETIYPFYSMFPIGYITEESSTIIPLEIKNYGNYHDCWRHCNFIPIEESIRYNLHAKSYDLGWNLAKSNIRIFPNEKINEQTYTYIDINRKQQTKTFNISDYYQKLHLHRDEAVSINNPNHITAPCTSYELTTFDKVFWENEQYTEFDIPIKPYLSGLLLTKTGYTLGISGIAKMLKEQTGVTLTGLGGLGYYATNITYIPKNFKIPDGVMNINYLFHSSKFTKFDYPLIIPSSVTDIHYIFHNNSYIEDLSNFDASNANIVDAQLAFNNCINLKKLPKLKFKENSKLFLNNIFNNCANIEEYPLSVINIPKTSYVDAGNAFYRKY